MARSRTPSPTPRAGTATNADKSAAQVQSLTRGLQILQRLAQSGGGVALTDLAQMVGLPNSTTHRLLGTLQAQGFVSQSPDLGLWRVGVEAFRTGNAFLAGRDVTEQAHAHLHRLMEDAGETANLALFDGERAVFVHQVECREMMRMIVRLGSAAPLHASGVGKAILAALPAEDVGRLLHSHGLARLTPHTLDTPARLAEELHASRARGFAIDDEEHAIGLRCAAAAVLDEHGAPLAAISVSGPIARLPDERIVALGALVARSAALITAEIGGRAPTAG